MHIPLKSKVSSGVVGKIKSVSTFCEDLVKGVEKVPWREALEAATPWAGEIAGAFGDALPPIKFIISVAERLTKEDDPKKLAWIALTIAYQRAAEEALKRCGPPRGKPIAAQQALAEFKRDTTDEHFDLEKLSFYHLLQHPFVQASDANLSSAATAVGYSASQVKELIAEVHIRLAARLKDVLSHGKTREKFQPLTSRLTLGNAEEHAYQALREHADYQRRQFEERPVFGREPFALSDIYVETDCGQLTWGEIAKDATRKSAQGPVDQVDPFDEKHGGRAPLLESVIKLLGNKDLREFIVIQGVAGSGKSSFTLRLSAELIRQGLRPIRVRLQDLRPDKHVKDALPDAVRLPQDDSDASAPPEPRPPDLFLSGQIFQDHVKFGKAHICPYVLILDAWDEVNIAAEEGFKQRIDRFLQQLRSEFIDAADKKRVRVILTGRPTTAVSDSQCLRSSTPILTIRPLTPKQLEGFIERLKCSLEHPSLPSQTDGAWTIPDTERFKPVLRQFKEGKGALEVLGLPLLSHLAVRLMATWPGDLGTLIASPTALLRHLVDTTCSKRGKAADDQLLSAKESPLAGDRLRELLQETAAAMTINGRESISFEELARRLKQQDRDLMRETDQAASEFVQVNLLIAFFFKGGHRHLGAEFVHKSFREYLFAERIVETLKAYGSTTRDDLPERTEFWKDFDPSDPRHELSRELGRLLAPHWLSTEVVGHLEDLIDWEIERSQVPAAPVVAGSPTKRAELRDWVRIRTALADLWDWWGEGVHLRPQPKQDWRGFAGFEHKTVAGELVDWSASFAHPDKIPWPARFTTVDGHLGDGLFRLCCLVHAFLNRQLLRANERSLKGRTGQFVRRYQVQPEGTPFVLFAPSGERPDYYGFYSARIRAAGWRPHNRFPSGGFLGPLWFEGTMLGSEVFMGCNLSHSIFRSCFAELIGFGSCNLKFSDWEGARVSLSVFYYCNFDGANLSEAHFDDIIEENTPALGSIALTRRGRRTKRPGPDDGDESEKKS